jgi:hypothetical protein
MHKFSINNIDSRKLLRLYQAVCSNIYKLFCFETKKNILEGGLDQFDEIHIVFKRETLMKFGPNNSFYNFFITKSSTV